MLHFERLEAGNILVVTPEGPLEEADFERFSEQIDTNAEARDRAKCVMIRAESFPGWENFEGFVAHLQFISEHHRQIERIAIVTDSTFLKVLPRVATLLIHPKIRQFDVGATDEALAWLETGSAMAPPLPDTA